jgi:hypothetical protein
MPIKPKVSMKYIHNPLFLVLDFTQSIRQINHGIIKSITHLKMVAKREAWVANP